MEFRKLSSAANRQANILARELAPQLAQVLLDHFATKYGAGADNMCRSMASAKLDEVLLALRTWTPKVRDANGKPVKTFPFILPGNGESPSSLN